MKSYYDHIIVGNGVAAAGTIEGIRSTDGEGSILAVSAEKHPVYGRPLISYLLEGRTDREHINYRRDSFYADNGCEVLYGERAEALDAAGKKVVLSTGEQVGYGKICIATGSNPFVPPFEGLEKVKNKLQFMTLDDALALSELLSEESRVLIMGAGLIGLKCAEGICRRVREIVVADLAPRILSSILDDECAGFIQRHVEKENISFLLGDTAERFEDGKAFMKSGRVVEFDILVLAVGVRANTALVKNAGGAVSRGIVVDTHMRTSLEDVFAAGDCVENLDISSGTGKVMAILPNAYAGGFAAGVNMAGGTKLFDNAMPMNSIGFFGLHAMTAGTYEGQCEAFRGDDGSINSEWDLRGGILYLTWFDAYGEAISLVLYHTA